MLLQMRNGRRCVVRYVLLSELQEFVDEDQRRTRCLKVLRGRKKTNKHEHWSHPQFCNTLGKTWKQPCLKDFHKREKAVLKRPLVVAVKNQGLQQLQDGQHVAEEGHVVLLPQLVLVQVNATVEQTADHGEVSAEENRSEHRFYYE